MTIAVATECRRVTDLLIEERDDALRERDEARRNQNGRRNRWPQTMLYLVSV